MFEILKSGGLVMIPLVLASIVMVGIILERFWTLRRSAVIPPKLGAEVRAWARSAKIERDHLEQLRSNSPLGAILAAVVAHRQRSREVIRQAAEDTGRQVVHRLGKSLNALGTIASISPLLGLLGTVTGMMASFSLIGGELNSPGAITGGIAEALIATAFGLGIAITSLLPFNFLNARLDEAQHELDSAAAQLEMMLSRAPQADTLIPHAAGSHPTHSGRLELAKA